MHKYRAAARHSAWYTAEDEPPNYNPFQRIKSPSKDAYGVDDLESGPPGTRRQASCHSADCASPVTQQNRQSQYDDISLPHHASTMPRPANAEKPEYHGGRGEDSQESSGTADTLVQENGTRQRKSRLMSFKSKFHKSTTEEETINRTTTGDSKKTKRGPHFTFMNQIRATLLNSWINILLVMVPVGIALNFVTNINPIALFVVNFIAIIPLAAMLSYATEEIALRTGETIGGLLNASFGNAVELIVSIIALVKNEVLIVQTSLVGSILSNLLLVMGMCFFFGGLRREQQYFNETVAQTAASLLALAVSALIIPTAFQEFASNSNAASDAEIAKLSRGTCILLLLVYGSYLFFQLKTHTEMYNKPSQKTEKKSGKVGQGDATKGIAQIGANFSASMGGDNAQETPMREPDEQPEPQLHFLVAIATLAISTALVGICAEFMVGAIGGLVQTTSISPTFVGLILLPIVGNAAEHATAVTVACKDKMDLAIGVAVGSSMQIALLVIPFVVTLGWIMGNDKMTLQFDGFQVVILFVAVLLVNYLIADGKSHWLEGVLLQTLYLIIAIAAWLYPPPPGEQIAG